MANWIKCSERMPGDSGDVIVYSKSKKVCNGYWFGWTAEEKKWYLACGEFEGPCEDVTHWQPLPEPPQE